ncbi:MAG: hypothetical protein EKK40_07055 [Bradyrhizobiaceae bacterium]|nr:MAG: hypothetical protein EKK40_07055 [Bradyrhizobiaceae bacterium]
MTAVPFPILSAPGRHPQASGGRLINVYPDQLAATAGQQIAYWRVPGLKKFKDTSYTSFRGALQVGNLAYAVFDDKVATVDSSGTLSELTGVAVPGTAPVIIARDNSATPNLVIVSPGDGAVAIVGGDVVDYPDADIGQPNGVYNLKSFFIFTYGDGTIRNSDANSLNINTLNQAAAEYKPDTLYRPFPLPNGTLGLAGSASTEFWGGENDTGFIFSYISGADRGIVGPNAITGFQDGFGKGIFAVTDDFTVSQLNGYSWQSISTPDVEDDIASVSDKTQIVVSSYIARGRGFVVVQAPDWCWEYDTKLGSWHERESYLSTDWRALYPFKAFDKWLCGDSRSGSLFEIDGPTQDEDGTPLRMRVETGPQGAFPSVVRVNGIELYLTKGVGVATGSDPVQTDPEIDISISRDGGMTWSNPRSIKVGKQSMTAGRVRSSIWGQADIQGVRWRFDESSNVPFGFMGADMQADQLR